MRIKGFTLIELLVVVLIIGVLASIAMPQYFKIIRQASAAEGLVYIKKMADSIKRYHTINGTYNGVSWKTLDIDYTKGCSVSSKSWSVRDGVLTCNVKDGLPNKYYSIHRTFKSVFYDENTYGDGDFNHDILIGYDFTSDFRYCVTQASNKKGVNLCKSFGGKRITDHTICDGLWQRNTCYSVP